MRLSVNVDDELLKAFRIKCGENLHTMSGAVRIMIKDWLVPNRPRELFDSLDSFDGETFTSLPKFKGKFQEASPTNKGRIYPYEPKVITIKHNWKDALSDSYSERNESVFCALYKLKKEKELGNVNFMTVSEAFWKENWSQVLVDTVFKLYPIPEHGGNGIKVARFKDQYDVYTSKWFDDAKYWVSISCSNGVARVIIEDFWM